MGAALIATRYKWSLGSSNLLKSCLNIFAASNLRWIAFGTNQDKVVKHDFGSFIRKALSHEFLFCCFVMNKNNISIPTSTNIERLASTNRNYPNLNTSNSRTHNLSVEVQYKGAEQHLYTGLQVAKDPGVWIVWLGCALMVVGIYGAFLMSHRRIWIRIQNGSVVMGGNASKNPAAFERFHEEMMRHWRGNGGGMFGMPGMGGRDDRDHDRPGMRREWRDERYGDRRGMGPDSRDGQRGMGRDRDYDRPGMRRDWQDERFGGRRGMEHDQDYGRPRGGMGRSNIHQSFSQY
mgnify:CR=1 FL=1